MMAQHADEFIGLRVPRQMKKAWLAQAQQERRSLSNWILNRLAVEEQPSSKRPSQDKKPVN